MAVSGIDTSMAADLTKKTDKKENSALDKDAFLQLLVTQMQHQDPLQPTDNTEYMSQLAQFSEMEAMNNLNTKYSHTQAMNLVGEYVLLNTTDTSGNLKQVAGLVQYVTINNNQALLRVNDEYYSMDEFDSVVDWDYVEYINNQNGTTNESTKTENTEDSDKADTTVDTENATE
ncbi:MAG: hypothetical protein IJ040_02555 [Lachnospiraceae bacterium]|nr:hypothetical protein [Lachnospiraceae bacterium]